MLDDLRSDALAIFRAGIAAVEPRRAVQRSLRVEGRRIVVDSTVIDVPADGRVWIVGAGKAAVPMAAAAEVALGDLVADGVVVTKTGHGGPLHRVRVLEAAHPVPDAAGAEAAREIAALISAAGTDDVILCVISGGGSALLAAPAPGISLEDEQATTRLLLACGATINEMNAVRKHLALLKGGALSRLASPRPILSLILSDVVGDPLDVIASGPTVADPTTFADALEVLERRGILESVPARVRERLLRGRAGLEPETPKPGDPALRSTVNVLVGTNSIALQGAKQEAERRGYATRILSAEITGEARDVAAGHAALARRIEETGQPVPPPACILSGGETTVTVVGKGRGGRNQELALAAAIALAGTRHALLLSAGTDGGDGPTDAAGAVADGTTVERGAAAGRDARRHLDENDAYPFFEAIADLVRTGPTQTNVMDLHVMLVEPVPT
jgi:hydroxypyruvate reductase